MGVALSRASVVRGGLACNAAGDVFVVDTDSDTICKITPDGVVSVFVGGYRGSADGRGFAARFEVPNGMAIDAAGNLFVADEAANTIRKITPAAVVTTVAGKAGATGSADGRGIAARFNDPVGIACDADGDLYVVDSGNDTIRKIAPDGMVSTFAGKPGVAGDADGRGSAARFYQPGGIVCNAAGDLYVSDINNHTIRKITPEGQVTTVAGKAGVRGSADGPGPVARFAVPGGLALGADGTLYVSDAGNFTIRKITWSG